MTFHRVRALRIAFLLGTGVIAATGWAQSPQRLKAIDLVQKASVIYGQGNMAGVINLCQQAVKADSSYPRAYTWLGAAYQKRGERNNACSAYSRVVRMAPNSADATRAKRGLNELGCPIPATGGVGEAISLQIPLERQWMASNGGGVTGLAFSTDGQFLTGSSTTGAWYRWRTIDGGEDKLRPGSGGESNAVAASADFYAAGSGIGNVRLFDAREGSEAREVGQLDGKNGIVTGLAYSRDGRFLAAAGAERALKVYDGRTNQLLYRVQDPRLDVIAVAFSPDGRFVAASFGNEVRIFGAQNGDLIRSMRGDTLPVMSLAWSRDGQYLAAGSGYLIRVWNPNSGTLRRAIAGHRLSVAALSFGIGPRLASGGADGQLRVWNAASGASLANLRLHAYALRSVAFDSSGKRLASADMSGRIGLWRVP
jgi:WD40 repeat protein